MLALIQTLHTGQSIVLDYLVQKCYSFITSLSVLCGVAQTQFLPQILTKCMRRLDFISVSLCISAVVIEIIPGFVLRH